MKKRTLILVLIFVPLLAIQFVPVGRANPSVTHEVDAPSDALAVLRRSCFDCHSNTTKWPWYSYVAPMSWFVADHVRDGRRHMNFSEWDHLDADVQAHLIAEVWEEVSEGEMPLTSYLLLHGSARLSDDDRHTLQHWAEVSGATIGGAHTHYEDDD